jgi:LysR family nitrogen assimilation transcriptional regulator
VTGNDGIHDFEDLLDLQALRYFVQVSDAGGFSKASTILNVSQPTLTRHIQRLEKQFGARLFDRTGRGAVLTEAGESLYHSGRTILRRVQMAFADVSEIAENPAGRVILGLAPIAGKVLSVPVAQRFMREMPSARLGIVESFTGYVREWVANGRIDVGILYADSGGTYPEAEHLWEERFVVVGRRDSRLRERNAVPFAELGDLPLILPSHQHGLRMKIDETAARMGVALNVALEIDGLNVMLELVRNGMGTTILTEPALWRVDYASELVVAPIIDPVITSTVVAVHSRQGPVTNTARALMRIISEESRRVRQEGMPTEALAAIA